MASSKRKRALISVADKSGIITFAQQLQLLGYRLISTGGTASHLKENNIAVTEVSEITGMPEILGGRVKTLHPKILGGILQRPGVDDAVLDLHGILPFQLIVTNFYPFELSNSIENIDIGGPTMVRAAAKNYEAVTVVVDPQDYDAVLSTLKTQGEVPLKTRHRLAAKAFARTCAYDAAIAQYFGSAQALRYGENPHQKAWFYRDPIAEPGNIASATLHQGKALSYNNISDANAALECVKAFAESACVIVKHANPCGVALGDSLKQAYLRAYATDPTSSFGGIIAFNQPLDLGTAQTILEQQFVEVILAPQIEAAALEILKTKPNIRALSTGDWSSTPKPALDLLRVSGGLLVQEHDARSPTTFECVTTRQPSESEQADCDFAWQVVKTVKSNAIVLARDRATIGIGAGQMSRIMSTKIASLQAKSMNFSCQGAVMASDAFFPFRDNVDLAAELGITTIIQPGGSIRDAEVIAAANEHGITMLFTGQRHFKH